MNAKNMPILIENKLFLIYLLNVADWICTVVLLKTGSFFEANPIARLFIDNIRLGFLLKCVVPLVLVLIISGLSKKLDGKALRAVGTVVSAGAVFYTVLCTVHIINFIFMFNI